MNTNRRQFLQTSATAAALTSKAILAADEQIKAGETCPTAMPLPTPDDFKLGKVLQRQIPIRALNADTNGKLLNETPAHWTGRFAVAKGPCGIAKEWGPSHPDGADVQEFLDDDDPNPKSAEILQKLVQEFGPEAQPQTEYYEMGISQGALPVLTPQQTDKYQTGGNDATRILGYHEWKKPAVTPGPMFQARVGRPMVVRFVNEVNDYMSVHLHGSHGPAHSDGHPTFVIPKKIDSGELGAATGYGWNHRDYFYPHTVPAKAGVQRATDQGRPGTQKPSDTLDYTESPSTMWYHDHSMDITAPHAYLGLAGFFPAFDDLELRLLGRNVLPFCPKSGSTFTKIKDAHDPTVGDGSDAAELDAVFEHQKVNPLDLCIALQDKCFSKKGDVPGLEPNQLLYSAKGHNGHLGHAVLVNGMLCPHTHVIPKKMRLRILDGSNARIYKLALYARLEKKDGTAAEGSSLIPLRQKMPAHEPEWFRIGADTWLYPQPVSQRKILLTMAKRADTIVDFGAIYRQAETIFGRKPGDDECIGVYLCNLMDQENGRGPKVKLDEANAQEPAAGNAGPIGVPGFADVNRDDDDHRKAELDQPWPLLKFIINTNLDEMKVAEPARSFKDLGYTKWEEVPDASVTFGTRLRDHHPIRPEDIVRTREVLFHRGNGIWQINSKVVDEFVSNFVPELNTAECWILENGGGGWWHPIHIHLESHQQIEYLEESSIEEVRLVLGKISSRHEQALQDERLLGNVKEASVLESILTTLRQSLAPVRDTLNTLGGLTPEANDAVSLQTITRTSMKELADFDAQRLTSIGQMPQEPRLLKAWLRLREAYRGIAELIREFDEDIVLDDHRLWRRAPLPEWDRYKSDTAVLGPNTRVKIFMHFRTFDGPFVFHCHNLEHEDMRMMFVFDPRPTPPGVLNLADQAPSADMARLLKDEFHMREQIVTYRHPWRFIEPEKDTEKATTGPDFDKRPHADTLSPEVKKDPPWNQSPAPDKRTPRAHPIWGGWDQHL